MEVLHQLLTESDSVFLPPDSILKHHSQDGQSIPAEALMSTK